MELTKGSWTIFHTDSGLPCINQVLAGFIFVSTIFAPDSCNDCFNHVSCRRKTGDGDKIFRSALDSPDNPGDAHQFLRGREGIDIFNSGSSCRFPDAKSQLCRWPASYSRKSIVPAGFRDPLMLFSDADPRC